MSSLINPIGANQKLSTTSDVIFNTVTATGGYNRATVTTTSVLNSSAFGKLIVGINGPYSITLPTVVSNAGKYIDIFADTSSFAILTITPTDGLIQNQSTFLLGGKESMRLYCDGSNWWVQDYFMQPVSFFITTSTNQSISTGTNTKVAFDTIINETFAFYDNITNHRFTPLYPGMYLFYSTMRYTNFSNSNVVFDTGIYKNSSSQITSFDSSQSPTLNLTSSGTAEIMLFMNGTTDYIEFFTSHNDSGSANLWAGLPNILAGGYRISIF